MNAFSSNASQLEEKYLAYHSLVTKIMKRLADGDASQVHRPTLLESSMWFSHVTLYMVSSCSVLVFHSVRSPQRLGMRLKAHQD